MNAEEIISVIDAMTGPQRDRLRNAINKITVEIPAPAPAPAPLPKINETPYPIMGWRSIYWEHGTVTNQYLKWSWLEGVHNVATQIFNQTQQKMIILDCCSLDGILRPPGSHPQGTHLDLMSIDIEYYQNEYTNRLLLLELKRVFPLATFIVDEKRKAMIAADLEYVRGNDAFKHDIHVHCELGEEVTL